VTLINVRMREENVPTRMTIITTTAKIITIPTTT
jgi:hypothetical protein